MQKAGEPSSEPKPPIVAANQESEGYCGRGKALREIQKNITTDGYHAYLVAGGPCPRFLYTIGLREIESAELMLAGSSYFDDEEAANIVDLFANKFLANQPVTELEIKFGRTKTS